MKAAILMGHEGSTRREALVQITSASAFWLTAGREALAGQLRAGVVSAPSVRPRPAAYHPIVDAAPSPQAFTAAEFRKLAALVDTILPRTETAGAVDAGVPWFIDQVATVKPAVRETIKAGVLWLDQHVQQESQRSFAEADEAARNRVVTRISDLPESDQESSELEPGRKLFQQVKLLVIEGYFQSEMGMMEELQWVGNQMLSEMPGCPDERRWVALPSEGAPGDKRR
ncbi:MAG TPA: gluconate 2-dehydrogenase subunit 3 family protein [Terriglobia bacterium]|nr:gluconate 2-dehydrogenase subunit 3 family protein [Terriglobia bacterium]